VDKVRFGGEAVAAVVAEDRYCAEDALERVRVQYEPLHPVVDVREALAPGAALIHETFGTNLAARWTIKTGDVDAALARAERRLSERLVIVRGTGGFMETRGILAAPEPGGRITVWSSTQAPHLVQRLVGELLDLGPDQLRVVAPDVGGGFGPKAPLYPEDYLIPWLALQTGRSVRWIEDRREDLLTTAQERDCVCDVEVGFTRDGTPVAMRSRIAMPMPGGAKPGLEATEYFHTKGTAYSSGTNLAVVEVDPETGQVKVLRYVVVHDCGRAINPMIVDGQIHGGVVHGIGNTFLEDAPFGPDGQPLAATFMDYLLPTAAECPAFEVAHVETPTPLNPLGIKGCGESGTIPAAGTLIAAVEDALSPFNIRITDIPSPPNASAPSSPPPLSPQSFHLSPNQGDRS